MVRVRLVGLGLSPGADVRDGSFRRAQMSGGHLSYVRNTRPIQYIATHLRTAAEDQSLAAATRAAPRLPASSRGLLHWVSSVGARRGPYTPGPTAVPVT